LDEFNACAHANYAGVVADYTVLDKRVFIRKTTAGQVVVQKTFFWEIRGKKAPQPGNIEGLKPDLVKAEQDIPDHLHISILLLGRSYMFIFELVPSNATCSIEAWCNNYRLWKKGQALFLVLRESWRMRKRIMS